MSTKTPNIEHRAGELAQLFLKAQSFADRSAVHLGENELASEELALIHSWDQMTHELFETKFDCVLSETYDSATLGGLNSSVADKYLSHDPVHSFSMPVAAEAGRFSRFTNWTPIEGYSFFDYANFESIRLEEEIYESADFRQEIARRRQSMFGPRTARSPRYSASPDLSTTYVQMADDIAYTHPYPNAMGRTGATLLTPAQRRLAAVSSATGANRRAATLAIADHMMRRDMLMGPSVREQRTGQREPAYIPPTFDATLVTSDITSPDQTELYDDGAATFVDGLTVQRTNTPALATAIQIANTAFGSNEATDGRRPMPPVGGVFNRSRAERTLGIASLNKATHPEEQPGYLNLLYDAAERNWIAMDDMPARYVDASDTDSTFTYPSSKVAPRAAVTQLIAQSLGSSKQDAGTAFQAANSATSELDSTAPWDLSPVTAPVEEFSGVRADALNGVINKQNTAMQSSRPASAYSRQGLQFSTLVPPSLSRYDALQGAVTTTTGPELFSSLLFEQASTTKNIAGLVRPIDGPVSIAGEVHHNYGSYAYPMDDPVVYVGLDDGRRTSTHGLKSQITSLSARSVEMSQGVAQKLGAMTMPLSSAAHLMGARLQEQTSPDSQIVSLPRALRTEDSITDYMGLSRDSFESTDGSTAAAYDSSNLLASTSGALSPSEPVFYQFAYDTDSVLLNVEQSPIFAGSHVEIRDGQVVRAIPATHSAALRARTQPATLAQFKHAIGAIPLSTDADKSLQYRADLANEGIDTGQKTPIMAGLSTLEAGFPALSLMGASSRPITTRVDAATIPSLSGVLASATEAGLAMLPETVRTLLARQSRDMVGMTSGGTDTGLLLSRLASSMDTGSPAAQAAILHKLAALGVDTPELIRVLENETGTHDAGIMRIEAPDTQMNQGDRTADAGYRLNTQLATATEQLTGVSPSATRLTSLEQDDYWGDFAPVKMQHRNAADMLRALLGAKTSRGETRHSRAVWEADLGDMLTLSADGSPTSTRERDARGVTSRVHDIHLATTPHERQIQTPGSLSNQSALTARAGLGTRATDISQFDTGLSERLASVGDQHGTPSANDLYGWDDDAMALTTGDANTTIATRVSGAASPWKLASGAADGSTSSLFRSGVRGTGKPSIEDGARGFTAGGVTALAETLRTLATTQNISNFLGGGFDFAYTVLDRVNGALAGFDAGVLQAMQRSAMEQQSVESLSQDGRPLIPGLDDWPAEALSLLDSYDAQASGRSPTRGQTAEVERLERRVDAARDAYNRLRKDRTDSQSPRTFDSVDWSLVHTGAAHDTRAFMNLGSLGETMAVDSSLPRAEMSYVAPAVKVVAQQAQLSTKNEAAHSPAATSQTAKTTGEGQKKQKVDINAIAQVIAGRIQRRQRYDAHRRGRHDG